MYVCTKKLFALGCNIGVMNYRGGTRSSGYETDATPFVFYPSSVCTSSSLSPRVVCARETPFVFYPRVSAPPVPSLQGLCVPESSTGSQLKESTANVLEPLLVQVEMKQEAAFQLLHEQAVKWRPWSQNEAKIENNRSMPRTL
jgi:hypothetical protein